MPIRITVDQATTWLANRELTTQQISEEKKNEILPRIKYNCLVDIFHSSTVLLVIAVVSAILFAYTTAFVFGAIALFTRSATLAEFEKYKTPYERPRAPVNPEQRIVERAVEAFKKLLIEQRLKHALNQSTEEEKVNNIYARMGFKSPKEWEEDSIFIFDHPIWKNKIPEPNPVQA